MKHSTKEEQMERCNRPAWRDYPNGYRVCLDHAHVNDFDRDMMGAQILRRVDG